MVAQIDRNFAVTRPWKLWPRLLAYLLFEGRPLTTRGRWINPIVFGAYRLWSVLPMPSREHRPIFILGVGRTGTTVLGTVLALHRDVGYLNEPKALWQAALGDDDVIGSYSREPGRFRMSAEDADGGATRRLQRFYSAFLGLSVSRRIVDKYPELLFRTGLLDAVFPNARKIVLVRNGADTCHSVAAWCARHGNGDDDWWGKDRCKWHALLDQLVAPDPFFEHVLNGICKLDRHVDMAAVEWIVSMREAQKLQVTDDSMMFVRFERMAAQPRDTIADILEFCDLSIDAKVLAYAETTLHPRTGHPPPDLSPCIQALFDATMADLGYRSETDP